MRAILTYHSIDASGSVISVSPAVFEDHLRAIAQRRIEVVTLTELLRLPDSRDAVALTFDDAFTNFDTEAWPRLKARGFPATLFVPTRFVGRSNQWAELPGGGMPALPILDWSRLARLQEEGVRLGAHSRTHADLRTLDGGALAGEIEGSVEDVARETGQRPDSFAYPYGFWSRRAADAVRAAGLYGCTTELRLLDRRDDGGLLPRLDAYYLNGPARLDLFGRWSFRTYVRLRGSVRAVRGRLNRVRFERPGRRDPDQDS
jgi:peptidoglycan/xylan/chitin deacetylase (PgdA/CDA1 family)